MQAISFFDCNCMLGRRSAPRPESNLSDSQILEELERAGIEGALVTHSYGKEYHPRAGNERLVDICRHHPHLILCFTILPEGCGDFPGGDRLLDILRDGGAGAVALYPSSHSYNLGAVWCGNMLGTLAEAGVPALIELEQTSWIELEGALRQHPRLQVVLLRAHYHINRWLYPLLERYPGLRVDTSYYEVYCGFEEIAARFGADRLVFGTGMPFYDPGGAISPVLYSRLPEADRRRIAGENLRGLLWKGEAR